MKDALKESYKRYFRPHRLMLVAAVFGFLVVCTGDGLVAGWIGRYLIDDVLQVDQSLRSVVRGGGAKTGPRYDGSIVLPRRRTLADPRGPEEKGPESPDLRALYAPPVLRAEPAMSDTLAERIEARPGRTAGQKVSLLVLAGGGMVALHLLTVGLGTWIRMRLGAMNKKIVFHLRRHIYEKLLRLQMSYHDQHHVGRLISRAVEDIRVIERGVANLLGGLLTMSGTIIVSWAVMVCVSWKVAIAVLLGTPFLVVFQYLLRRTVKALVLEQRRDTARLYGLASDRLSHPRVVKGFSCEKREHISFVSLSVSLYRRRRRIAYLKAVMSLICAVVGRGVLAIVLGYGTVLLWRGEMTLGSLLFIYGAAMAMTMPLAHLGVSLMEAQHLIVVFERVLAVLGAPITIRDKRHPVDVGRIHEQIEFRDVALTYEGSESPSVRGVSFFVPIGAQVCLMGQSGSGKTTLAALLLRLYDPTEGEILLDGTDLRKVRNRSLRERISYVPQEPMLFAGTIESNIRYGAPDANWRQVVQAAKAAEIHDYIESLPEGYQSTIGEEGLRLSGGQKQRLSLARALITDPQVLVLDDCTSALDAHTEARIRRTLRYALKGKTVLMISHRASAAQASDQIVVLAGGRVVENGTHEELLSRGDHYWRLVADQLREESDQALQAG
jgi:ABC-type multidrug transport system fused ATPase/permease subunit